MRLIDSTPHESTTSSSPEPTRPAASVVACWLEPHWLSTVVEATSSGRPAESHAVRATLNDCSPTCETQPATICPTCFASRPARATAACMHAAEQVGGMHAREAAAAPAERRAHGFHDVDVSHMASAP